MKLSRAPSALGLIVVVAGCNPLAMADDLGWYLGGNVGQSRSDLNEVQVKNSVLGPAFITTGTTQSIEDTGYKVFAGYQFGRHFALEGGFYDLGQFDFHMTTVPLGTFNGNLKLRGFNLDAVFLAPVSQKLTIFARVGGAYGDTRDSFNGTGFATINSSPSKKDTNVKYGVGLQYAFNEHWNMRLEGERYRVNDGVGNHGNVNLTSLGLVYRFGGRKPLPVRAATPEPVREVVVAAAPVPQPAPAPAPPPPPPPRYQKFTLGDTELFAFDRAVLQTPHAKLDEIATVLDANKGVSNVNITGYTDRLGSRHYNQGLSERRANAVKDYLVGKGIDGNRLNATGKGEDNPVVECHEKNRPALIACLQPNRRVEIEEITIERRVQ